MKKKIIIVGLSVIVALGFLFWKFGPSLNKNTQPTGPITLTYWGLWEEENVMRPVIEEYQKGNPNVKINFVRQSSVNYRTRVQTQIREGSGPDVFMLHNSWLIMFDGDLAPAPSEVFSLNEYQSTFYPVVSDSFVKNNQIYGAPAELDGLALYYNEEMLNGIGGKAPRTWQEFITLATKMTVKDPLTGQIQTAGAALGTASNVDHWSDILGMLFLQQPSLDFNSIATPIGADVLKFYTSFVIDPRRKSWDASLPRSTQMFAEGRLGFYFAPSWRAHEIRQLNPNLKFKTTPVPQLSNRSVVGWASFWGQAVSIKSKHILEAWKFVKYLTSKEAEQLAYSTASSVRLFGEPYSRTDLSASISNDPIVGAFVNQGPYYKFWYSATNTYDAGINQETNKYFEDAVNSTLAGADPMGALQTVAQGITQISTKYSRPTVLPAK